MNIHIKRFEEDKDKYVIDLLVLLDKLSIGNGISVLENFLPNYNDDNNSSRTSYCDMLKTDSGKKVREEMYQRCFELNRIGRLI